MATEASGSPIVAVQAPTHTTTANAPTTSPRCRPLVPYRPPSSSSTRYRFIDSDSDGDEGDQHLYHQRNNNNTTGSNNNNNNNPTASTDPVEAEDETEALAPALITRRGSTTYTPSLRPKLGSQNRYCLSDDEDSDSDDDNNHDDITTTAAEAAAAAAIATHPSSSSLRPTLHSHSLLDCANPQSSI